MLLAIDTSAALVGAACVDGGMLLSEVVEDDARRHGELLAPAISEALRQAGVDRRELDGVAVGVGPGPFTGLRVGVSTALVMSRALGIPAIGVCSLDALASSVHRTLRREQDSSPSPHAATTPEFLVATDARRKEIYWARYGRDGESLVRVQGPFVTRPADLPGDVRAVPAYGRGGALYPEYLSAREGHHDVRPAAVGLCAQDPAWQLPPEPLYLRRPDAVAPVPATPVGRNR